MSEHTTTTTNTTSTIQSRPTRRRIGAALAIGLGAIAAVGVTAGTVAAEQPERFSDSFSFVDINPCTGQEHEITIHEEVRFVDHGDGTGVFHIERSGTTSDGYTMKAGVIANRRNGVGVELGNLNDVWMGEDGSKFQARGSFRFDYLNNELLAERFRLRCIKG